MRNPLRSWIARLGLPLFLGALLLLAADSVGWGRGAGAVTGAAIHAARPPGVLAHEAGAPTMLCASVSCGAAPVAASETITVMVSGFSFSPPTVTIDPGDTVVWIGLAGFHNVRSDPDATEEFYSGSISPSLTTFSYTFTEVGENGYYCEAHGAPGSGMFGTVIVAEEAVSEQKLYLPVVIGSSGDN